MHELVKTCQDAIYVTRRLGLQYCWIDSLCIIQDDSEDWKTEAAKMASVHANAYICLAATAKDDGDAGFLGDRAATESLMVTSVDGKQSAIWARVQFSHTAFHWRPRGIMQHDVGTFVEDDGHEFPLLIRGWAFQERLLSPRILHFTTHEIVFECLGSSNCECGAMDQHVGGDILRERQYLANVPRDIEIRCGRLDRAKESARKFRLHDLSEEARSLGAKHYSEEMRRDLALMYVVRGKYEHDDAYLNRSDRWPSLVSEYSQQVGCAI